MAVPPPSSPPANAAKPAVRARLRALRREHVARLRADGALLAAGRAAAERVAAHLPAGAVVALYRATGSELDPAPLAALLHARGHPLALPHVADDRTTMRFLAWHPDEPLETGAYALAQPRADNREVAPQAIVTPLLGFDRAGGRIGQGAGYYDRAFAALPGAVRIGYAWSVQALQHVPLDPWDVPLHAVATERDWFACGGPEA